MAQALELSCKIAACSEKTVNGICSNALVQNAEEMRPVS